MDKVIDANQTIFVENNGEYRYKDVKNLVVALGKHFYFRHDPSLVKIKNPEGKIRYFRQDSPYLVRMPNGKLIHKANAILTEDGIYFEKDSAEIVKLNGKIYRKNYTTTINGETYLLTDKRLVKDCVGNFFLASDVELLDQNFYGPQTYLNKKSSELVKDHKGRWVRKGDCLFVLDGKTNEERYIFRHDPIWNNEGTFDVFHEFQDKTNPQEGRLNYIRAMRSDSKYFVKVDFTRGDGPVVFVNHLNVDYVNKCIDEYIMPRMSIKMEETRAATNALFSDLDDSENKAKVFKVINKNWPGKHNIYTPDSYGTPVKSKQFNLTGGLKYSFGVEFETSQGLLTDVALEKLQLKAVGDRSIGAAEYVTGPMEGNNGVELLREDCAKLAEHTLVDDRCGLHVHVGGLSQDKSPSFSKEFIKNAINLGALLEEELYASLPPNRVPTLYHCHSIRRFGGVTAKNFDENVGAFIFGPKELWFDGKGHPKELFKFSDYKLNADRNTSSQLGTWAEGRYKWLNLIHAYTRSEHRTIEFRIFPGTTSFEKTYMYLLFALSFTYVIDNCPRIIKEGVTIADVINASIKDEELAKQVIDFYSMRKKRFNRKQIYPKASHLTFLK